jgi:hypothetical protein
MVSNGSNTPPSNSTGLPKHLWQQAPVVLGKAAAPAPVALPEDTAALEPQQAEAQAAVKEAKLPQLQEDALELNTKALPTPRATAEDTQPQPLPTEALTPRYTPNLGGLQDNLGATAQRNFDNTASLYNQVLSPQQLASLQTQSLGLPNIQQQNNNGGQGTSANTSPTGPVPVTKEHKKNTFEQITSMPGSFFFGTDALSFGESLPAMAATGGILVAGGMGLHSLAGLNTSLGGVEDHAWQGQGAQRINTKTYNSPLAKAARKLDQWGGERFTQAGIAQQHGGNQGLKALMGGLSIEEYEKRAFGHIQEATHNALQGHAQHPHYQRFFTVEMQQVLEAVKTGHLPAGNTKLVGHVGTELVKLYASAPEQLLTVGNKQAVNGLAQAIAAHAADPKLAQVLAGNTSAAHIAANPQLIIQAFNANPELAEMLAKHPQAQGAFQHLVAHANSVTPNAVREKMAEYASLQTRNLLREHNYAFQALRDAKAMVGMPKHLHFNTAGEAFNIFQGKWWQHRGHQLKNVAARSFGWMLPEGRWAAKKADMLKHLVAHNEGLAHAAGDPTKANALLKQLESCSTKAQWNNVLNENLKQLAPNAKKANQVGGVLQMAFERAKQASAEGISFARQTDTLAKSMGVNGLGRSLVSGFGWVKNVFFGLPMQHASDALSNQILTNASGKGGHFLSQLKQSVTAGGGQRALFLLMAGQAIAGAAASFTQESNTTKADGQKTNLGERLNAGLRTFATQAVTFTLAAALISKVHHSTGFLHKVFGKHSLGQARPFLGVFGNLTKAAPMFKMNWAGFGVAVAGTLGISHLLGMALNPLWDKTLGKPQFMQAEEAKAKKDEAEAAAKEAAAQTQAAAQTPTQALAAAAGGGFNSEALTPQQQQVLLANVASRAAAPAALAGAAATPLMIPRYANTPPTAQA